MSSPSIRNANVRPSAIRWTQGDTLPPVDGTGNAAPLLVDATTGKLLVDAQANVSADLTLIEGKMDTANGIATAQAADVATIRGNSTKVPGFSIPAYDYISCSYTGSNLTGVVYKTGGSSGTTVATLILEYDGSNNLTSVTKS
jgi:hypothetical protein